MEPPLGIGAQQWRFIGELTWDPGGRPYIYVQQGNQAPMMALIDTGASISLIKTASSRNKRTKYDIALISGKTQHQARMGAGTILCTRIPHHWESDSNKTYDRCHDPGHGLVVQK